MMDETCLCGRTNAYVFRKGPQMNNDANLMMPLCTISHYGKQTICRVPQALDEDPKTLGKGFAECYTRQIAHGKFCVGKHYFAECQNSSTRQTFCRRPKNTR